MYSVGYVRGCDANLPGWNSNKVHRHILWKAFNLLFTSLLEITQENKNAMKVQSQFPAPHYSRQQYSQFHVVTNQMLVFDERKPEYPGKTLLLHTTNASQILLFLNHSIVALTKLSMDGISSKTRQTKCMQQGKTLSRTKHLKEQMKHHFKSHELLLSGLKIFYFS